MSKYVNEQQKSLSQRFLFVLRLLMFTFYLVAGSMFILWKDMPVELARNYRIAFGVILIVYSFLRFIRLVQDNKN